MTPAKHGRHAEGRDVAVIIAARNAAATIALAIRSALRQREVVEIVVADDASSDDTAAVALATDDGTGRVKVLRLQSNVGPGAARNRAIAATRAPFLSVLDADDCLLDNRFGDLLDGGDWDLVADNIMFVEQASGAGLLDIAPPRFEASPRLLAFGAFVDGNISRRGAHRGELGFLKPVIRRAFLDRHGLRYDERLRLGEDYELYARAMLAGARFRIVRTCGYLALVRGDSLSGRHRTEDLKRLADADHALLARDDLTGDARAALVRHEAHVRDKHRLRRFLDIKAQAGLGAALRYAASDTRIGSAVGRGVFGDKMRAVAGRWPARARDPEPSGVRFLLAAEPASAEN